MFESFLKPSVTFPSQTGSIVTFNSQYAGLPLKSCVSQISGYQEGSGTPSPDNVRPLHAFSSATLTANSNTYTFTFGQSIYQGSIDWERGVVVGTWGVVDLGSLSWRKNANLTVFDTTISDIYNRQREEENRLICSAYSGENVWYASSLQNGRCMIRGDIKGFYIRDDAYSIASDFKTAMNGVMLAYELATPIEIPLGGINLLTQQVNNIWADTGETTASYINIG